MDVNPPGLMLMLVAPLLAQPNVLLPPELMLPGFAAKETIVGPPTLEAVVVTPPQPAMPNPVRSSRAICAMNGRLLDLEEFRRPGYKSLPYKELVRSEAKISLIVTLRVYELLVKA